MSPAAKASEVHFLSYNGINIIDALNMIAEAWGCEWWVTYDTEMVIDSVTYTKVIHFGECRLDNTPFDFSLGENVESMDISRDQQTFANRIYAFGGSQNVPEDYGQKLEFTVDEVGGTGSALHIQDTRFPLTLDMVNDTVDGESTKTLNKRTFSQSSADALTVEHKTSTLAPDTYTVSGTMTVTITKSSYTSADLNTSVTIEVQGMSWQYKHEVSAGENQGLNVFWETTFEFFNHKVTLDERGVIAFTVVASGISNSNVKIVVSGLSAVGTDKTASKSLEITYNGETYDAVLNAGHYAPGETGHEYISRIKLGNTYISGIVAGDKFSVPEKWLDMLAVPYSYYTPLYDTGVMSKVGERRIHLPADPSGENNGKRYVEASGISDYTRIVEEAVVFDDISPRLLLKVASVATEEKVQDVVHDDDSVERQNWTQYKITATKTDGSEFRFDTRYLMDGADRLKAVFTAPANAQSSGYKLAGMTFEVGFDNNAQVYTIVRNEDYGAKIPNRYLYPSVGDEFFLVGWNPKAISGLGIVGDAEKELLNAAIAYRDAIQQGNFTASCALMSRVLFDGQYGGGTIDNAGLKTYGLLLIGAQVTLNNAALPGGSKTSRVIGYDYKLDMPYDTPMYIIGETEAYSRIKQIEKKLTKLT